MQSGNLGELEKWLTGARILLIDDEPANLEYLRRVLETEGYAELIAYSEAEAALDRFDEIDPDLIIVDLMMPGLDGFGVIARVGGLRPTGTYLPILVATGDPAPETRRRALAAGARDFMTRPLSPAEVRLRARNLLETRFLHEQLRGYNALLEDRVAERTREVEDARLEILLRLARAAEFRDDETGQHTFRVGGIAGRLAEVLGLDAAERELIGRAALLHDVGKIGIPDAILLKPDRLEPDEFAIMQTHTLMGANILSGSRHPLLQLAEEIALSHHERWDGGGYPNRLAGEAIPLSGRIVAVADVFDSLSHERPYKRAWSVNETLAEIAANAGAQFDPDIVDALLQIAAEAPSLQLDELGFGVARQHGTAPRKVVAAEWRMMKERMRSLEAERDDLAREVRRLRRQLERRDSRILRLTQASQPI